MRTATAGITAPGAAAEGPSFRCRAFLLIALALACVALIARYAWLLGAAVAT